MPDKKPNILVIGSSNVDLIMQMDRFPAPGESVFGKKFEQVYGGKGANQAIGAARSGGHVTFITCLGNDVHAEVMLNNFKRENIDTSYVIKTDELPCGTAIIQIDKSGENCIAVSTEANGLLTPDFLIPEKIPYANWEYGLWQCEIPVESVFRSISAARDAGVKTYLNLAPAKKLNQSVFGKLDGIILNETEAAFLAGTDRVTKSDVDRYAKEFHDLGPRLVIVTFGAEGAYYSTGTADGWVAAFPVTAVDTTAAGDTFCGALVTALSEGQDIVTAITFANAAAALAVTGMGAQTAIPERASIDQFLSDKNRIT